jgi:hypothetical protein
MITNKRTGDVTHVGQVIGFVTKVERIMSDVYADVRYAVCFTGSKVEYVAISNGEFGATDIATVDATDEVKAKAFEYFAAQATERMQRERAHRMDAIARDAKTPMKGKEVEVVKGRKLAHGLTGIVFWTGDSGYGPSVGFNINKPGVFHGKGVFTSAKNVVVTHPEEYMDVDLALDVPDYTQAANAEAAKRLHDIISS